MFKVLGSKAFGSKPFVKESCASKGFLLSRKQQALEEPFCQ